MEAVDRAEHLTNPWARMGWIGFSAALLLGAVLRLMWGQDIEYKGDENWTFERTQAVGRTEPFPWLGMQSSADIVNPGMSVWVFLALGKITGAADPVALARAVQMLNITALILLAWFAMRLVPPEEREPWLWAIALGALNPFAVLFQRKIWPPSVFPIFTLMMLIGWWRRERRGGAFAWGLVGACLGQIHMSGFFFAAAFVGWMLFFDRKRVAWLSWLAGSVLGSFPLIPWVCAVAAGSATRHNAASHWTHLLEWKLYFRWITEPLGLGLNYTLGRNFTDFLRYPIIHGHATYVVGMLHAVLLAAGGLILIQACRRLWSERRHLGALWIGRQSQSAFAQAAAFWGFGLLLTGSTMVNHRHYLIVTFPLIFLWLTRLALGQGPDRSSVIPSPRKLLTGLCAAQALLSICFLDYIHENQQTIHGDYGMPYAAQAPRDSSVDQATRVP
jgi:hypothetical protein